MYIETNCASFVILKTISHNKKDIAMIIWSN
jgi:hypothetical protein